MGVARYFGAPGTRPGRRVTEYLERRQVALAIAARAVFLYGSRSAKGVEGEGVTAGPTTPARPSSAGHRVNAAATQSRCGPRSAIGRGAKKGAARANRRTLVEKRRPLEPGPLADSG